MANESSYSSTDITEYNARTTNFQMQIASTLNDNDNITKNSYMTTKCKIMWILFYILIEIFILSFVSFTAALLTWIFATLSSDISIISIILWTLCIFVILQSIIFGLFMICKRHRRKIKKWVTIRIVIFILEYIILLFMEEIALSTTYPNLSIFPNTYSYNALTEGDYTSLYEDYLNISQTFFDCNLDVSMVKIRHMDEISDPFVVRNCDDNYYKYYKYYGGVMEDTVYIACADDMISEAYFIRLLTYIWQFDNGLWYGSDGLSRMYDTIFPDPNTNINVLSYGDLDKAWDEGKDFFDFDVHQQTHIIQDYYKDYERYEYVDRIRNKLNFSDVAYDGLEAYATQYVLKPC